MTNNLPPFINELRKLRKQAEEEGESSELWDEFWNALFPVVPDLLALAEENERLRKIVEAGEELEEKLKEISKDIILADYSLSMTRSSAKIHSGYDVHEQWLIRRDEALRRYREAVKETKE